MKLNKKFIIFLLIIIGLFNTGCVNLPNYNNNARYGSTKNPNDFKYGKYCGNGHPSFPSKPGTAERTRDLINLWPPVDDIDLMCYAHDLCYQIAGSSNLVCDQAVSGTAALNTGSFNKKTGCENLNNLILLGFGVKFYGSEKSYFSSKIISLGNIITGIPMSLSYLMLNNDNIEKYGYPKHQGICYKNNLNYLHVYQIISDFEERYREMAKGYRQYSGSDPIYYEISIPIPIKNWNKNFLIFEIQKYLNYYGYNAGQSDGKNGDKTSYAVKSFSHQYRISPYDYYLILKMLKNKFNNREYSERNRVYLLDYPEKEALFNYMK